jgi:hypothetical protein
MPRRLAVATAGPWRPFVSDLGRRIVGASQWDGAWRGEAALVGIALASVLIAQGMLSRAIHGTTYRGPDGAMVQTAVLTAFRFGGAFNVTNVNPLQGMGSQLFPKNAWANPAFWPFAVFPRETAADVSSLVALACFALACYVMARCFDVPVVPSAVAAQGCILLFAPTVLLVDTPRNFSPTPADGVTYAPFMIALGLLARVSAVSPMRRVVLIALGITACGLYSTYCDPAFAMIPAFSWAAAFAVVTVWPSGLRAVALRGAALAGSLLVFIVSGAAVYLYTLSHYSARVHYARTVDRVRIPEQASALFFSGQLHLFYLAFAVGVLAGLVAARGRARVLVVAAVASWSVYVAYATTYLLLLDAPWVLPMPLYVEQCLFVLFMSAAVAGTWAALQRTASGAARLTRTILARLPATPPRAIVIAASVAVVALIPVKVAHFAAHDAEPLADVFRWPWADEPELVQFLGERVALSVGGPFRGFVNFLEGNEDGTIEDLRSRGVPTLNEYSQTATAPSLYFLHVLMKRDVRGLLNRFEFHWRNGSYTPTYWRAAQMLGVRYTVERWALPEAFNPGLPEIVFPYHVPKQPEHEPPGFWHVYELPRPNLGDYSPTEVTTARSAADIMAALAGPGFDFTRQVVLSAALPGPLTPARDVRLTVIRNGLHLSAHSDGTSLVVLPQQFSKCLRARDPAVRLLRANLLVTGVVFSGRVDTDITFDYGIFSPWCRLDDLADLEALDMKIDLHMRHLGGGRVFPEWRDARTRLEAAARHLRF